ncbi:unnamed protein product [Ectocarpus sp. 8 AP-2014]
MPTPTVKPVRRCNRFFACSFVRQTLPPKRRLSQIPRKIGRGGARRRDGDSTWWRQIITRSSCKSSGRNQSWLANHERPHASDSFISTAVDDASGGFPPSPDLLRLGAGELLASSAAAAATASVAVPPLRWKNFCTSLRWVARRALRSRRCLVCISCMPSSSVSCLRRPSISFVCRSNSACASDSTSIPAEEALLLPLPRAPAWVWPFDLMLLLPPPLPPVASAAFLSTYTGSASPSLAGSSSTPSAPPAPALSSFARLPFPALGPTAAAAAGGAGAAGTGAAAAGFVGVDFRRDLGLAGASMMAGSWGLLPRSRGLYSNGARPKLKTTAWPKWREAAGYRPFTSSSLRVKAGPRSFPLRLNEISLVSMSSSTPTMSPAFHRCPYMLLICRVRFLLRAPSNAQLGITSPTPGRSGWFSTPSSNPGPAKPSTTAPPDSTRAS